MKKNQMLYLLLFVATISFVAGCKKKNDPAPVSKTQLLAGTSSKSWKVTAATVNLGQPIDLLTDQYSDACERDNLLVFYSDKKYEEQEGATKCDPDDDNVASSGTWSLSTDEKTLSINGSGGSLVNGDVTITELSNTTLKGTFTFQSIPVNVTLTAQ